MAIVYLALGSNIGDSKANIAKAVKLLTASFKRIKQAPLYASKAVGYTDQPDFLNTAMSGQTDLSPEALLDFIRAIERQIGRTASFRWGPREIDIDIVLYGDLVLKTAELTIPHPQLARRDFVLRPICDLDASLIEPLSGQTVEDLLAKIPNQQRSILQKVD